MKNSTSVSRRNFIRTAGLAAGGAALVSGGTTTSHAQTASSPIPHRKVGKTDLHVPVVSVGTGPGQDPFVIKLAINKGIHYFHTSNGYKGGNSIRNLAKGIANYKDKIMVGLKHRGSPDIVNQVSRDLDILGLDQADIVFFNYHGAGEAATSDVRKAADTLRESGKARYIGLTTHKEQQAVLREGIASDIYDVLNPSYNLGMPDDFIELFKQAEDKGIGTILMKAARGDIGSVIPKLLSLPSIASVNRGMTSASQMDELIEASRKTLTARDARHAEQSAKLAMIGHCGMCGECDKVCPNGLPLADIMRCSDYYLSHPEYYELAEETLAEVDAARRIALCGDCGACEATCPFNAPIRAHLRRVSDLARA